jgi:Acetyl-coenzyme A synthetase N-terminus
LDRAQSLAAKDRRFAGAMHGEGQMTGYTQTHRRSLERPEEFWAEAAEAIDWERRWDRVLDTSRPPFFRWFPGARLMALPSSE